MNDIAKTVYNLINTNGGKFKSDKQKSFLLSLQAKCFGALLLDNGQVYNNSYSIFAVVDNEGIVSITKDTSKKTTILYSRENHAEYIAKYEAKKQAKKESEDKMQEQVQIEQKRIDKRAKIQKIINKYNFTCEHIIAVVCDAVKNNKQWKIKDSVLSIGAKVDKLKVLLNTI